MKTKLPLILSVGALICTTGCLPIQSKLKIDPATGTLTWGSPKDVSVESVEARIETNGVRSLSVKNWKSSNNPEVLKATADGNAQIINAVGTQVNQAVQTGAQI
jgi:hypothetical protein